MDKFDVEVNKETFECIENGRCEYLVFLGDKQHLEYKVDNVLNVISEDKSLKVVIKNILSFLTVKDLIAMIGKSKCGFSTSFSIDKIEDELTRQYKAEKIEKYGLIAANIVVI